MTSDAKGDPWAAWLGGRRYGGDPKVLDQQLLLLGPIRDQVIANAAVGPSKRVLDVGCGED